MKSILLLVITLAAIVLTTNAWDESEITGYHFHTYFFQNNKNSYQRALLFRRQVHEEIEHGSLKGCRVNHFNVVPTGPHPIGSFETCCNSSSLSHGMSWFMLNRGNHSVLFHPLTRYEIIDHTDRVMFLGSPLFIDLTPLEADRHEADTCDPIPYVEPTPQPHEQ
ncbi:unnamed protein product [Medioppia subpectinata]|uniref:DOPA 4,5-dioxygenase n=1 Tax=Medioppia subpectinata TaxID=1979941 RepID=A0A7R9KMW2_9ACAR|nr:unnamed protein product [Medioppia subpectinata]CAG2105319.1 unnamed protein product [Medioppia subpectinata]